MWEQWNVSAGNRSSVGAPWDAGVPAESSAALRVLVCAVYMVVCAAGLLGNLLVLVLLSSRRRRRCRRRSSIDLLVLNLAATDLQFVLTLPFWAADIARDFSWPFGAAACKLLLTVTVTNMYASVFFLTAMSVSRCCAVASGLTRRRRRGPPVRWVIAGLWLGACAAALPTAVFSTVKPVAGERLCLLAFPPASPRWLALAHVQKTLLGFLLPLLVVCASYLRLLRYVRVRSGAAARGSRVTRSVSVLVLAFFLCWMPNHAVTFWGVLVKFNVVSWDRSFYLVHTYVHPLTVCLAHTNSCLNPLLYCLMLRDFRNKLKELFWRFCSCPPLAGTTPPGPEDARVGL